MFSKHERWMFGSLGLALVLVSALVLMTNIEPIWPILSLCSGLALLCVAIFSDVYTV